MAILPLVPTISPSFVRVGAAHESSIRPVASGNSMSSVATSSTGRCSGSTVSSLALRFSGVAPYPVGHQVELMPAMVEDNAAAGILGIGPPARLPAGNA